MPTRVVSLARLARVQRSKRWLAHQPRPATKVGAGRRRIFVAGRPRLASSRLAGPVDRDDATVLRRRRRAGKRSLSQQRRVDHFEACSPFRKVAVGLDGEQRCNRRSFRFLSNAILASIDPAAAIDRRVLPSRNGFLCGDPRPVASPPALLSLFPTLLWLVDSVVPSVSSRPSLFAFRQTRLRRDLLSSSTFDPAPRRTRSLHPPSTSSSLFRLYDALRFTPRPRLARRVRPPGFRSSGNQCVAVLRLHRASPEVDCLAFDATGLEKRGGACKGSYQCRYVARPQNSGYLCKEGQCTYRGSSPSSPKGSTS